MFIDFRRLLDIFTKKGIIMKLLILSLFLVSCGHSQSVEVQVQIVKTEREILLVDIDANKADLSDNAEIHLVENATKEALKHKDNKHLKLVRVLTKMLRDTHDHE